MGFVQMHCVSWLPCSTHWAQQFRFLSVTLAREDIGSWPKKAPRFNHLSLQPRSSALEKLGFPAVRFGAMSLSLKHKKLCFKTRQSKYVDSLRDRGVVATGV